MAHFQRQRSYSYQALHVGAWCSGNLQSVAGFSRMAATGESDGDGLCDPETRGPRRQLPPASTRLRRMWRRIVTKNMKMVIPPPTPAITYDLQTYQQNFDEGAAWAEPDNLCRSFSARFAIPSGVL
ncbi:hypothetical protein ZIOFF_069450 [Zingiber officinale]|uniref:Uncharacterized protein n=1 Tax=Zingiber officinale TaxID=94328 RepID=A0A8J5EPX5_ZINOF|nr:hypothetical protein ZIOFF_069450 [Zingiber officinale]